MSEGAKEDVLRTRKLTSDEDVSISAMIMGPMNDQIESGAYCEACKSGI